MAGQPYEIECFAHNDAGIKEVGKIVGKISRVPITAKVYDVPDGSKLVAMGMVVYGAQKAKRYFAALKKGGFRPLGPVKTNDEMIAKLGLRVEKGA